MTFRPRNPGPNCQRIVELGDGALTKSSLFDCDGAQWEKLRVNCSLPLGAVNLSDLPGWMFSLQMARLEPSSVLVLRLDGACGS